MKPLKFLKINLHTCTGKYEDWFLIYPDKIIYHHENDGASYLSDPEVFEEKWTIDDVKERFPRCLSTIIRYQTQFINPDDAPLLINDPVLKEAAKFLLSENEF